MNKLYLLKMSDWQRDRLKWSNFDFWWFAVQILHHIYQLFLENIDVFYPDPVNRCSSFLALPVLQYLVITVLGASPTPRYSFCSEAHIPLAPSVAELMGLLMSPAETQKLSISASTVINFRDKNDFLWQNVMMYHDMSWFVMLCHDMPLYVWKNVSSINSYSVLLIVILFYW